VPRDFRTFAKEEFPTFAAAGRRIATRAPIVLRRAMRILLKTGKVALVALILAALIHTVLLLVWKKELDRELDRLRAQGKPVCAADLKPKPIPDSQNAAVLYNHAFALVRFRGADTGSFLWVEVLYSFLDENTKPQERATAEPQVRELIRLNGPVFPLVRQAVSRPNCIFPLKWRDGYYALRPHLWRLRYICEILAAKAIIEAKDGQTEAALTDLILALRVARTTKDEPDAGSFGVSRYATRSALNGLALAFNDSQLTPAQARRVYDALGAISYAGDFPRVIDEALAMANSEFDYLRSLGRLPWDSG